MKVFPVSFDQAWMILRLHGMKWVDVKGDKLDRGIVLFTGARLIRFKTRRYVFSYQPRMMDVINLRLWTREEIFERVRWLEAHPNLYKEVHAFRSEYDAAEQRRLEEIKSRKRAKPTYWQAREHLLRGTGPIQGADDEHPEAVQSAEQSFDP